MSKKPNPFYGYYVNCDERGIFYADVRDHKGETIFEIRSGDSLLEDESSIFEDGFMRDKNDLAGLTNYLRSCQIILETESVIPFSEFERRLED